MLLAHFLSDAGARQQWAGEVTPTTACTAQIAVYFNPSGGNFY